MAHRYFTENIKETTAKITGPDALHLSKVLRAKPGNQLVLCDGNGWDYEGEITEIKREEILLKILNKYPAAGEPSIWAEMYIGMAKGDRMDYAVQKSVELGASVIVPFYSANTVVKSKNDENKNIRFTRIAQEAAKQCGRGILPRVEMAVDFPAALKMAENNEKNLFFYEAGGESFQASFTSAKKIGIFTGPEGGFTPQEASLAREAGCATVSLGPRILRCETAPVVALTLAMAFSGNLE